MFDTETLVHIAFVMSLSLGTATVTQKIPVLRFCAVVLGTLTGALFFLVALNGAAHGIIKHLGHCG